MITKFPVTITTREELRLLEEEEEVRKSFQRQPGALARGPLKPIAFLPGRQRPDPRRGGRRQRPSHLL